MTAACVSAHATDYSGGDWAGADLILADGDRLDGTFANVGRFEVSAGARVTVRPRVPFKANAGRALDVGEVDDHIQFPTATISMSHSLHGKADAS